MAAPPPLGQAAQHPKVTWLPHPVAAGRLSWVVLRWNVGAACVHRMPVCTSADELFVFPACRHWTWLRAGCQTAARRVPHGCRAPLPVLLAREGSNAPSTQAPCRPPPVPAHGCLAAPLSAALFLRRFTSNDHNEMDRLYTIETREVTCPWEVNPALFSPHPLRTFLVPSFR